MTAALPSLPDGFAAEDDKHGGWRISRAGIFLGVIFPVPADPKGRWYARRYSEAAKGCKNRVAAVDHITQHPTRENR